MSKEIPLTQGKVAIVDDEDYAALSQYKWQVTKRRHTCYARRAIGGGKYLYMHTAILGKKEGFMADHINGNGLDNRRDNLRLVTQRQNSQNRHIPKASNLGQFADEYEAYLAYCKAVKHATGEEALMPSSSIS